MSIYSAVLNNLAPFHTLAGIPIVSGAIHSAFFVSIFTLIKLLVF